MYMLIFAGILGGIASWLVKWAKKQAGSLRQYLFTDFRYTVLAGVGYIGLCWTAIGSGIFVNEQQIFVGWANVLWFGITNGFGADMVANKGSKSYDPITDTDRRGVT